jgi:hypothetical protein
MSKFFDYLTDNFFDPTLQLILAHPLLTILVISILVWWVGQAYKTRIGR